MKKFLGLFSALSSVVLVVACKSEKRAPPPDPALTAGSAATAAPAPADGAPATFPLGVGESYFGGRVMATNLVNWKVADGTTVQLGIVTTGTSADGRAEGVLRAYHVGTDTHDVGPTYSLAPTTDHRAELEAPAQ